MTKQLEFPSQPNQSRGTFGIEHRNTREDRFLKSIASLIERRKYKQAMQLASLAIRSHPGNSRIYALFTSALRQSGNEKRALTFVLSALEKHPNSLELNVEYLLLLYKMRDYTKFQKFTTILSEQLTKLPQSKLRTPAIQNILNQLATSALTVPHFTPRALETLHQAGRRNTAAPRKTFQRLPEPGDTVKIGIFSSQICQHVVGRFFSGFAEQIKNFPWEVTLYYDTSARKESVGVETARAAKALNITYKEVNLEKNPSAAKAAIKKDKLHLILELAGRFDGSYGRILNDRLAPVQASWIGYPHHPGFQAIDYFLTDQYCQPKIEDPDAEKKIYRFDRLFSAFDPTHLENLSLPNPTQRRKLNSEPRFISLNHARKINDDVLRLWARVLRRIPQSTITFKSNSISAYHEEWIIEQLLKCRVATDRVHIVRVKDTPEEHLSFLNNVDIALDTFPYNGTTTTCDALYMGVPTITLLGDQHVSRVTGAILVSVGCNELIARNEDDFVDIAVNLAEDKARLARYRTSLRENMLKSELCDSRGMADAMQKFIEDVLYQ